MAGSRYNKIPQSRWAYFGEIIKGLDADVRALEAGGGTATGNIDASNIVSGIIARARLGTGTADATTFLSGDGTWKAVTAQTTTSVAWADVTGKPTFATVATSGLYADLVNKPVLANVATSGAYADLSGKPDLTLYATKASPTFTGTVTFTGTTLVGVSLAASAITSGTFATARLGTGTSDSTTVLYGDGTWKTAPTGGGTATTDASQLTSGTLANARLSTAVPLVSRDPASRPTTDANVMVQFWCSTQPTAMLTNDVWMQTA